jgi:hypothetical protein
MHESVQEVPLFTFLFWDCVSLKMEALRSSEMALTFYEMTRRNIREELNLQQRCENLKSSFNFNVGKYMFVWKPKSRRYCVSYLTPTAVFLPSVNTLLFRCVRQYS